MPSTAAATVSLTAALLLLGGCCVCVVVALLLPCSLRQPSAKHMPATVEEEMQLTLVENEAKFPETQALSGPSLAGSSPENQMAFAMPSTTQSSTLLLGEPSQATTLSVAPVEKTVLQTMYATQNSVHLGGGSEFEGMEETQFGEVGTLRGAWEVSKKRRVGPFHDSTLVGWKQTQLLGRGSFGDVYLGDIKGRQLALKTHQRKSEEEARDAVAQVQIFRKMGWHRNIVSLLDVIYVCDTHTLCVFMEYVDGPTLSTLAQAGMEEAEAARIMRQVVAGVRHLHSHDLVHRDIKGENVLLTADRSVAKLCDFGFLKTLGEPAGETVTATKTVGNTLAGTPGWMAPEVVDMGPGFVQTGKPADIYSIGCTLSEALNRGVPPGPEVANVWAWVAERKEVQGLPDNIAEDISDDARNFIETCLQVDPDARPCVEDLEVHSFFGSATIMSDDSKPRSYSSVGRRSMPAERLALEDMVNWAQTDTLGQGSFGTVYLGQLPDARQVAVKVVTVKSSGKIEKLRRQAEAEFRLLESLQHPNIVQCLGHMWSDESRLEIFLELVTGGTVRNLVKRMQGGRLMDSVVRVYTRQVLCALDYLHAARGGRPPIAHRDIKGENLLIDKEGTIKLADFGCSKLFEGRTSGGAGADTFVGTPNWMAPEVLSMRGRDVRSYGTKCDIWSLGCTIIEMLGRTPWREKSGETSYDVMHRIATSEAGPSLPHDLAPSMQEALAMCLKRNPDERASAAELLAHSCFADEGSLHRKGSYLGTPLSPPRRRQSSSGDTSNTRLSYRVASAGSDVITARNGSVPVLS
eukprot:TRINITY_DN860_c0_g1_i14.p1 TRINITY_DN860_c0_g1~~TRINITY_DN860_c0_g1_i14.p1  ORF type:complete len:826 (+),score=251.86 TRINITY_DN860_c0_g1_i14:68-2479(+)